MAELMRLYNYDGSFIAQKASDPSVWLTVIIRNNQISNGEYGKFISIFSKGLGDSSVGSIPIPRLGKSLFRRQEIVGQF
jgi:hypothetical protein